MGAYQPCHTSAKKSAHPSAQLTRVLIAPMEYAPPAGEFYSSKEIARLRSLKLKLLKAESLASCDEAQRNGKVGGGAGNGKVGASKLMEEEVTALNKLLKTLAELETFYDCLGVIIGYQITVLILLAESVHGQSMKVPRT